MIAISARVNDTAFSVGQSGEGAMPDAQPASVAQRDDQFALAIEQPLGVDRRQVGDAALGVQSDGVALGGLLRRSLLVVPGC